MIVISDTMSAAKLRRAISLLRRQIRERQQLVKRAQEILEQKRKTANHA